MSNRTILITGCSSGIGYCCACSLKAKGWRVFATARKQEDIQRLSNEGFEVFYLDYTDRASIKETANAVLERTEGHCFALFNNGTYGQGGAVEDLSRDVLTAQFEAMVFGWHDLTMRLLPGMMQAKSGRIVQCSSVLGLVALPWRGAYNAAKFAVEGLTDTMRIELRGTGVEVSTIEPGPIVAKFDENALANLVKTVDIDASRFADRYRRRLEPDDPANPKPDPNKKWRLGPEAVFAKLEHALESNRPKPHYFVTTPTYLMEFARRVLPFRLLDRLAGKVA